MGIHRRIVGLHGIAEQFGGLTERPEQRVEEERHLLAVRGCCGMAGDQNDTPQPHVTAENGGLPSTIEVGQFRHRRESGGRGEGRVIQQIERGTEPVKGQGRGRVKQP